MTDIAGTIDPVASLTIFGRDSIVLGVTCTRHHFSTQGSIGNLTVLGTTRTDFQSGVPHLTCRVNSCSTVPQRFVIKFRAHMCSIHTWSLVTNTCREHRTLAEMA